VYAVVFTFLLIFLPLIIAYNSASFYLRDEIYFEQPQVKYRYQAIVQMFGKNEPSGAPLNIFYSTSAAINNLNSNIRIPLFQSAELDDNRDGITDRIEVNIQMPLGFNESITRMDALFYETMTISNRVKYVFDGISFVSYDSNVPMGTLQIDGDILLRQTQTLLSKGGFRAPYESDPLLSITPRTSANDISLKNILLQSASRNLSTVFSPSYQYAERTSVLSIDDDKTPKIFNTTITMRIPVQPIRYSPNTSEVLKFAFIQYIAFFAVVAFALFRVNSFVFRHQLIYTRAVADIVVEKMD